MQLTINYMRLKYFLRGSEQHADSKPKKNDNAEYNTIPTENPEIMTTDILHQEVDAIQTHNIRYDHTHNKVHPLHRIKCEARFDQF